MAQVSDQSSLDQDKAPQKRDKSPDVVPLHPRDSPGSTADSAAGWLAQETPKAQIGTHYVGPDWTPAQKLIGRPWLFCIFDRYFG